MQINIKQQIISQLNNHDIIEYTLTTTSGFTVKILNYGGIITEILTPDRNGKFANIVLKNNPFDANNDPYYGAIIGRIAGRIRNSQFSLNNKTYTLAENREGMTLHGGNIGLDKKLWQITCLADGLKLNYLSPNGEEGFPGNLKTEVSYRIINDYQLQIEYFATTDQDTIANLTNHSYFDLTVGENPMRMELTLPADQYGLVDKLGCFNNQLENVANTPFDFRHKKALSKHLLLNHEQLAIVNGGYDHPFLIDNKQPIILQDSISGRIMKINTTEPCCVVYTANWHQPKHAAICLETQKIPDAINLPAYQQSVIVTADKHYSSRTTWEFGVI